MPSSVEIRCPATSANLGPGFDALGLALGFGNVFRVTERPAGFRLVARDRAEGCGAERVSRDPADNLVVRGVAIAREALGLPPVSGLDVEMELEVPTGRGLGSSATAVVAGVLGGAALADRTLDPARVIELATSIEGHADNVTPCALGGLCAVVSAPNRLIHARVAPPRLPALAVAIPLSLEKSTEAMRRLLPGQVPFGDAVETLGRLSLLLVALLGGAHDLLPDALDDRLHQPYRGRAIPGWDAARAAALAAGAYGLVISGSGPTLLVLASDDALAAAAGEAVVRVWAGVGVRAVSRVVGVDLRGATVKAL